MELHVVKGWKWQQGCVAIRNSPSHQRRVKRMAAAWMEGKDPNDPLVRKVKDILHWDYFWTPYTAEDLLSIYTSPPDEQVREALIECGYTKFEAFTRSSICQDRKEQECAVRVASHYRTRRSRRGPTHGDALHVTIDARKRKSEQYLDTYAVRGANMPPAVYGITE